MHIGLIGGIGPAATEFYYRKIVRAHALAERRLALTISHADSSEMIANMEAGAADAQAEIFAAHVDQLRRAGCEAAAITSMGGHFCIRELEARASLPMINAIPALDAHFRALGAKRIGVLGTRAVMESGFYGGVNSVEIAAPKAEDMGAVHAAYIAVARACAATSEQIEFFDRAARKLLDEGGADVIVLAGTDLFLAFGEGERDYQVVDSAEVHIGAITRRSLSGG